MGLASMRDYIQKYMVPVDISCLRHKRIAIDGHMWLCEVMRGTVAHSSSTKKPHLGAFYSRCRSLIEKEIEPIVVFDNLDDPNRLESQNGVLLKKDREHGTGIWARDVKAEMAKKVEEIKELLNAMGVRWMASKLEGEAQCAQLEKRGLVHGCITRDFDYILFGGNNLYQVEFGVGEKPVQESVLHLSMDYISDKLCLSRSCLIAMSLMMGCDYYQKGIPGVGIVTALEIVSEFYTMKQDHPQVILDRFKAYATNAVPVRETDSAVKKKLKGSCAKMSIDLRDFNPNSDLVSNAVNVYVTPCVIEYSRTQLPKKVAADEAKVLEILMRECSWDPSRPLCLTEKPTRKYARDRNHPNRKTSVFGNARRTVVAACSREEGANCSKREWAAMERLRWNASFYKFNPVIEVISLPSTSEEVGTVAAKKDAERSDEAKHGIKRRISNGEHGPPCKQFVDDQTPTTSGAAAQNGSPTVVMRNGEMVTIDEQRSDGSASDIIVIEDIGPAKNTLQVIQSTA